MNPLAPIGWLIGFLYSALARPIQWALEQMTQGFDHVPVLKSIGSFGIAIIVVTLVIRGLLFPLFGWQIRTSRRTQAEQRLIAPQLKELRKKHRNDPQTLNAEMMKLYREHNISPFSPFLGCLPLLVQLPIIGGLYNGIRDATSYLTAQHLHPGFLWIGDLSQSAKEEAGGNLADVFTHKPWLAIVPLLAALATFLQSKIMMQPARPDMSEQERMAYNTSRQMVFLMPAIILLMGLYFGQGITLYWVTQSTMMIAQEWVILGFGGLRVPSWVPGAGRVTPLSFSNPASTSLAALGSKAKVPPASEKKAVRSGRGQVAPRRETPDGAREPVGRRSTPATQRATSGAGGAGARRRAASGSGGRRKRGR